MKRKIYPHRMLGHCGEVATRMTGKYYGYEVVINYKTCEAFSVGKVRQKNLTNRQCDCGK
jgi:hypothetical protein